MGAELEDSFRDTAWNVGAAVSGMMRPLNGDIKTLTDGDIIKEKFATPPPIGSPVCPCGPARPAVKNGDLCQQTYLAMGADECPIAGPIDIFCKYPPVE